MIVKACSVSHPKITFFCSLNCITSMRQLQHMLLREVISNTREFYNAYWIQNTAWIKSVWMKTLLMRKLWKNCHATISEFRDTVYDKIFAFSASVSCIHKASNLLSYQNRATRVRWQRYLACWSAWKWK